MSFQYDRDFLEFHSIPFDILSALIVRADELATHWDSRSMPQTLKGKSVGIIADDTGWRNTTAFDLGVQAMGGISAQPPIHFNFGEDTADLAGYLENWFDLLIVRTKELETLKEIASSVRVPVINARTRSNHPCETLGDLAYIRKVRGSLEGLKVVGIAPDENIFRSWVEASKAMPIDVVQVYPDRWHVIDPALLNANFEASQDIGHVFDADVIVTDSWPKGADDGELMAFQVTTSMLNKCKENVIFLPCPPVVRDQEVAAETMEHSACQSRRAKAYLLHAQNALMEWAIGQE